jgi:hypothetical protein
LIELSDELVASAPAMVQGWLAEQAPFERNSDDSSLVTRYHLDDHSDLDPATAAAHIARRHQQRQPITIEDVGQRHLTEEEIAWNQKVFDEQRQTRLAEQRRWEQTTVEGSLITTATGAHQRGMAAIMGRPGAFGGTCSIGDQRRMIRLTASSFGDFSITIDAPPERFRYEFGPPGRWICRDRDNNLVPTDESALQRLREELEQGDWDHPLR